MDHALAGVGCISFAAKDYIWEQNKNGPVILRRKKRGGALLCERSDTAFLDPISLRITVTIKLPCS